MEQPCMRAYSTLLIKTCHRRGIFAMGGMSAQIPVKNDPQANEAALQKVRATPVDSWLTCQAHRWRAACATPDLAATTGYRPAMYQAAISRLFDIFLSLESSCYWPAFQRISALVICIGVGSYVNSCLKSSPETFLVPSMHSASRSWEAAGQPSSAGGAIRESDMSMLRR